MMNYVLYKVAPGSYDLELDGELIGGVVRTVTRETAWTAELLDPLPAEKRPRPFKELEHELATFEAVLEWLGGPAVHVKPERKAA
jgi:hypothetical protein